MKLRRFGNEAKPLAGVDINYNLISFRSLLRHLRGLPGLIVCRHQTWLPTDDHWAELSYKGHAIFIDSEFVDYSVWPGDQCPDDVFQEVVAHLEAYAPWWLNRFLAGISERHRAWTASVHLKGRDSVPRTRLGLGKRGNGDERQS